MIGSRASSLAAAFCAAACGGLPDANPLPEVAEFERARSPRFDVVCHFPCARSAEEALAVADFAWERASELFPAPDSLPAPFVVRLYRAEAFRAVASALARDHIEEGAAFSSPQRRTAYVELTPPVSEQRLRRSGLPNPTLRLIAHEAAHLTFYAASGGAPRLPDWLSEGAAQAVEREAARARALFPGADDPRLTAQAWRAYSLHRTARLPSLAALLVEGPNVAVDRADYAVRALAFEFLREREPELWETLMATAARRIGSPDLADTLAAAARARIGSMGEILALDTAFVRYVASRAAATRWLEVRGIPAGHALPHAGLPGGRVTVLARDPWRDVGLVVSGRLEAYADLLARSELPGLAEPAAPDSAGGMGVVLGRGAGRQIVVGFDPRAAAVFLRREEGRGGAPTAVVELGRAPANLSAPFSFQVRLAPDAAGGAGPPAGVLEVWIDGAQILRYAIEGADGRGDWGVVAQPGAAGVWSELAAGPWGK
ncbi:MAG TPA: hypothetical protein VML95_07610 [Longimicrobiales bacterium]|nr:hypothetical protein [Longimicrobiales bacterium]